MKSRLSGILLLFCLIVPTFSSYLYLQIKEWQVKMEGRSKTAGLGKEDLVLLKFSRFENLKELRWEHSKEFEYQGKMYDIKEVEMLGDSIFYWCYCDVEETELNKQLVALVTLASGNDPVTRMNQERLVHFFKADYFVQKPLELLSAIELQKDTEFFQTDFYRSIVSPPLVPPPKGL